MHEPRLGDPVRRRVARDLREVVRLVDDDDGILIDLLEAARSARDRLDELLVRHEDERRAVGDLVLRHVERTHRHALALGDRLLDVPRRHGAADAEVLAPPRRLRVPDRLGLVQVSAARVALVEPPALVEVVGNLGRLLARLGLVGRRRDVRVQAEPLARQPERHDGPFGAPLAVLAHRVRQLVVRPRDPHEPRRPRRARRALPREARRERGERLAGARRRLEQRRPFGCHRAQRGVHDLELRPVRLPALREIHRVPAPDRRRHARRFGRVELDHGRRQRELARPLLGVALSTLAPQRVLVAFGVVLDCRRAAFFDGGGRRRGLLLLLWGAATSYPATRLVVVTCVRWLARNKLPSFCRRDIITVGCSSEEVVVPVADVGVALLEQRADRAKRPARDASSIGRVVRRRPVRRRP
mmetsp:Transcript_5829/g.24323  ORF Transcript_5829/g.24323 Transcript_5829/m.24323 type:complete len:414 (-) Transcript_5829:149-1390(-)